MTDGAAPPGANADAVRAAVTPPGRLPPGRSATRRQRVVVAMSGGVDSSVVAALLANAGHEVIGITLQLYDHGTATHRKGSCCAGQDIHDAARVSARLGIAHYVLDYEQRFKASVMDAFAASYIAGETPIPCVSCNTEIKFRDLLAQACAIGCDYLATGHYIQRRDGPAGPELIRASDETRDQSYFLFQTSRAQLEKLWFPLGAMRKAEVREAARALDLAIAEKPDSQDICFVPHGRYASVIERLKPGASRPGNIVHLDGRTLGRHDGIIHYTIGQRRGLKVAGPEPLFVIRLDGARDEVVVGPRDALRLGALLLRDVNWLGDTPLVGKYPVHVRLRSTHTPTPAIIETCADGRVRVALAEGEGGIACGQACVFYDSGRVEARLLGGGFIAGTLPLPAPEPASASTAATAGQTHALH